MPLFHPIHTIKDREQMLKNVLSLQTQIRTKRKKERLVDKSRNRKYAKIFEPITRTLRDLSDISVKGTENLIDTETPPPNDDDLIILKPEVIKKREEEEEKDEEKELNPGELNPGELYRAALKIVPLESRDDGKLGLNTDTQEIGDYTFSVHGNLLKVINDDDDEDEREYIIDDIHVWIILLAKSPGNYMNLKRPSNSPSKRKVTSYVPAVKRYIEIANDLNLLKTVERYGGRYYKRLSKYQILKTARLGKGFLFSSIFYDR